MTTSSHTPGHSGMPPLPRSRRRRLRDIAILAGMLALFVAGLFGLAMATGWEETLHHIKALNINQVSLLLALSLINYILRGLRWHNFTQTLGLRTDLAQDLRHFLGGLAMAVTPGRVGELVRLRWINRETGCSIERAAPLALVDRAADLAALALVLALGLALSAVGINGGILVFAMAFGAAFLVTRPRLLSAAVTLAYRIIGRWPRQFSRLRSAARELRRFSRPGVLGSGLALGAFGWLAEGYAFHLLLVWMGADIGFWTSVSIFVLATLAGGLTGAPGGIGGAEAAMIALLQVQGVPLDISIPATAVIRLTTLWFAILIGLCVFPYAERLSKRAMGQ